MSHDALERTAAHLKEVKRAGWVRAGHGAPESVAAHSWAVSFLALLRCPPGLDRERLLVMAILHDLAEARVGDITPHDGVPPAEKHAREAAAMNELLADRPDLLAVWEEAEARQSPEAVLLKQLDVLDMKLQAEHYSRTGQLPPAAAQEFIDSANRSLHPPASSLRPPAS